MDYFKRDDFDSARQALGVFAALNIIVTAGSVVIHVIKFFGTGFAAPSALILGAVAMLHFFSSGMSLAVAMTGHDKSFTAAAIAAGFYILILDILGIFFRVAIDPTVTPWFRVTMWIFTAVWLFFTLAEIVTLSVLQGIIGRWHFDIDHAARELNPQDVSDHAANHVWQVPRAVFRARRVLNRLWPVELVLVVLFLLCFAPGFMTGWGGVLLGGLSLQHIVQWSWIRAVAGPVGDTLPVPAPTNPYGLAVNLTPVLVTLSTALDSVNLLIRLYALITVDFRPVAPIIIIQIGTPVSAFFHIVAAVIITGFVVIDILELTTLARLNRGLQEHSNVKEFRQAVLKIEVGLKGQAGLEGQEDPKKKTR